MPSKQENQRRKKIVKALNQKEFEDALANKPISNEDLCALIDHLEDTIFLRVDGKPVTRCDHTLNRSRAFLESRGLTDIEKICDWFGQYGGFCDCEVAFNVADYWYDKVGR